MIAMMAAIGSFIRFMSFARDETTRRYVFFNRERERERPAIA